MNLKLSWVKFSLNKKGKNTIIFGAGAEIQVNGGRFYCQLGLGALG